MKHAKNLLIVLLALTTIGAASLAWRQYKELVELRGAALDPDELADLRQRVSDLEKTNRALEERLAALQAEEGDPSAILAAAATGERPSVAPGAATDRRERGDRGSRGPGQFAQIMSRPEVQAILSASQKDAVTARYAALFRNLNLSPEDAAKLTSLLLERQNTPQDVFAAAREQGLDPRTDREAIRKLVTDAQNAVNDSIKSVIGDAGFAQLSNFEQTMPQRELVNVLQQRLTDSNAPLTTGQADQLVQILAANTPARENGTGGNWRPGGDQFGRLAGLFGGGAAGTPGINAAPVTAQAMAQAQTVLTPAQASALREIQQQQQNQAQLRQIIRQSQGQNSGGTGGVTGRRRPPGGG